MSGKIIFVALLLVANGVLRLTGFSAFQTFGIVVAVMTIRMASDAWDEPWSRKR